MDPPLSMVRRRIAVPSFAGQQGKVLPEGLLREVFLHGVVKKALVVQVYLCLATQVALQLVVAQLVSEVVCVCILPGSASTEVGSAVFPSG